MGISQVGKAAVFGTAIRRFESSIPSQTSIDLIIEGTDKVTYSVLAARRPYREAEWFDSTGRKLGSNVGCKQRPRIGLITL